VLLVDRIFFFNVVYGECRTDNKEKAKRKKIKRKERNNIE
jgi:hypothetical protein